MASMNQELVSVCMPVYNQQEYVVEALDSVLIQDFPKVELVIINDGSTDETHRRIDEWIERNKERIPILYKSRENRGICYTVNELVRSARGDFIARLDSDDCLLPGSLSRRVEYLRSNPNKKAVFGDCKVVDASGVLLYTSALKGLYHGCTDRFYEVDSLKQELLYRFCVPGPAFMAVRSVFDVIGLYDESLFIDDWDMYLRLAGREILGFLDEPVAVYRWHGTNICRNRPKNWQTCRYERIVLENNRCFFDGDELTYIDQRIRTRKRKELEFRIRSGFKMGLKAFGFSR